MGYLDNAIEQTLKSSGRNLDVPLSPADRVLATLKRLRHFSQLSFIQQTANKLYPKPEVLSEFDVENALVVLKEDGLLESERYHEKDFYRIKRARA